MAGEGQYKLSSAWAGNTGRKNSSLLKANIVRVTTKSGEAGEAIWSDWFFVAAGGASATSSPGTGSAVLTGFSPTVSITDNKLVQPGTGILLFNGFSPVVSVTDNEVVRPGTGQLFFTGFSPYVVVTSNRVVRPGTGQLILTGYQVTVIIPVPPTPYTPGGGGSIKRNYKPPEPVYDDDLLPIIRYFLEHCEN